MNIAKMVFFSKIWEKKWVMRSILHSVYFNFHYLPFSQAIHLPIILYKPSFVKLHGKLLIKSSKIKMGMIKMGRNRVPFYPNTGILLNIDGIVEFQGECDIGNDSKISVGRNGMLVFGKGFSATSSLKLCCLNNISFSDYVTVGWDCIFMDSDFHRLKKLDGGYTSGMGVVSIGKYNWFACRNTVLKNTVTPDYCTVSSHSILNKNYLEYGSYIVLGMDDKIIVKSKALFYDPTDDNSNKFF